MTNNNPYSEKGYDEDLNFVICLAVLGGILASALIFVSRTEAERHGVQLPTPTPESPLGSMLLHVAPQVEIPSFQQLGVSLGPVVAAINSALSGAL
jgi:hypothetical protein